MLKTGDVIFKIMLSFVSLDWSYLISDPIFYVNMWRNKQQTLSFINLNPYIPLHS